MDLVTPGIGLVFWTTIIFLTLLIVLGKVAWKPINNAIKKRSQSIEDALRRMRISATMRQSVWSESVQTIALMPLLWV